MVKKILVLLATYNGEKYIYKQVNSIINQKNVDVTLIISDDNSSDSTIKKLKKLKKNNKNRKIKLIKNTLPKINYSSNFYNLIISAPVNGFDYIAYSDQDDIFSRDKFINSIDMIEKTNFCALSSSVRCFEGSNRVLHQSDKKTKFDFLFEGAGQGNTFIMKRKFFSHFQKFVHDNIDLVNKFYYHDWLTYIYCRANNYEWFFYNKPTTKYRINKNNIAGDRYSLNGIIKRVNKIFDGWYFTQINLANTISMKINMRVPNLRKLKPSSLFIFMLKHGRRKYQDRIISALLIYIFQIKEKIKYAFIKNF